VFECCIFHFCETAGHEDGCRPGAPWVKSLRDTGTAIAAHVTFLIDSFRSSIGLLQKILSILIVMLPCRCPLRRV
jgi:hypothetical protein